LFCFFVGFFFVCFFLCFLIFFFIGGATNSFFYFFKRKLLLRDAKETDREGEREGNHRTTLGGKGSSTQMATKRKYIKMNSNIKCSSCYGGFLKLVFQSSSSSSSFLYSLFFSQWRVDPKGGNSTKL